MKKSRYTIRGSDYVLLRRAPWADIVAQDRMPSTWLPLFVYIVNTCYLIRRLRYKYHPILQLEVFPVRRYNPVYHCSADMDSECHNTG